MTQSTDAAQRSAHVERGPAPREVIWPVVEISPGQWKLRAIVDLEAQVAELRAQLAMRHCCPGFPAAPGGACTCDMTGLEYRGG